MVIAKLHKLLPKYITIGDGTIGMEGNGPLNGNPAFLNYILASKDPVAIDQVSVDLVNQEPALAESAFNTNIKPGEDKFRRIYPKVDWQIQLDYAETLGLGTRKYELLTI